MLILPIRRVWLDKIISEEKREEYREIKPYWTSRFVKVFADGRRHVVRFRAGYRENSPWADCLVALREGQGRREWGAAEGQNCYVLEIHAVAGIGMVTDL